MISALITVIGVLIWFFTTGKLETAGFVIFVIGFFYLCGDIKGYKFRGFTTNAGG